MRDLENLRKDKTVNYLESIANQWQLELLSPMDHQPNLHRAEQVSDRLLRHVLFHLVPHLLG